MLSEINGIKVTGHAVGEQGAIEQISATHPDVVVLDIALCPGSGINVLQFIKKHSPSIKVLMLTNYADDFYRNRCIKAGADHFLDKSLQFLQVGVLLKNMLSSLPPGKMPSASNGQ